MSQGILYRVTSDGVGIYEAVEKLCPKDDPRRVDKPDGSWLSKKGKDFPDGVSFWTEKGLDKYKESGLYDWHKMIVGDKVGLEEIKRPVDVLYEDEYQVIIKKV